MALMTAKYRGICYACSGAIRPGEPIDYEKGVGARHAGCAAPEIPPDAVHLSGGSGYGCTGWDVGSVVRNTRSRVEQGEPEYLWVLRSGRSYYRDDGMSFGVGDEQGYVYWADCRAATEGESAALRAEVARAEVVRAARRRLDEVRRLLYDGQYLAPTDTVLPQGRRCADSSSIYGGGGFLLVEQGEHPAVWRVQQNGMDGDDWRAGNVKDSTQIAFRKDDPGGELGREVIALEERITALKEASHAD